MTITTCSAFGRVDLDLCRHGILQEHIKTPLRNRLGEFDRQVNDEQGLRTSATLAALLLCGNERNGQWNNKMLSRI